MNQGDIERVWRKRPLAYRDGRLSLLLGYYFGATQPAADQWKCLCLAQTSWSAIVLGASEAVRRDGRRLQRSSIQLIAGPSPRFLRGRGI